MIGSFININTLSQLKTVWLFFALHHGNAKNDETNLQLSKERRWVTNTRHNYDCNLTFYLQHELGDNCCSENVMKLKVCRLAICRWEVADMSNSAGGRQENHRQYTCHRYSQHITSKLARSCRHGEYGGRGRISGRGKDRVARVVVTGGWKLIARNERCQSSWSRWGCGGDGSDGTGSNGNGNGGEMV